MMEEVRYCRACLATDVKMFSLATTSINSIGTIYSQLSQIPIEDSNQHVCYECAHMLQKYHKFKSKCHRAFNILSEIHINSTWVSRQAFKHVDRKLNKLESNLINTPVFINTVTDYSSDQKEASLLDEKVKIKDEDEPNNVDSDSKSDISYYPSGDQEESDTSLSHESTLKVSKVKLRSKAASKRIRDGKSETSKPKKRIVSVIDDLKDHITVVSLTPEDARKELLSKKESSRYMKLPYKCDLCYKGYGVKAAFENHMIKHSVDFGEFECEFCHLRFPRKNFLYKHNFASHQRKFTCKSCSFVTYCISKAKSHVGSHIGKTYPCEDCSKVFSKLNTLVSHRRNKHAAPSRVQSVCEHCGSAFGTARGLVLHHVMLHRQDKNDKLGPKCEECDVHFASDAAWKRHLVLSSKHQVSNGCKDCGETFSNADELKTHSRVHSRSHLTRSNSLELPAACTYCDKWLSTRGEYKSHVTSQHPHCDEAKRLATEDQTHFVCEVCGKSFKQRCHLRYHQRRHTGERPHACATCGARFALASVLAAHSATHAPRALSCHVCARTFALKYALRRHVKTHLGIRPHKCALCDKGFIHRCDLRLHVKYVHDKVPWPKKRPKHEQTMIDE